MKESSVPIRVVSTKHYRVNPQLFQAAKIACILQGEDELLMSLINQVGVPIDEIMMRYSRKNPALKKFEPMQKGGMTVVIVSDGDDEYYGVSYCSLSEQFSYKKGRQIALGRAMNEVVKKH